MHAILLALLLAQNQTCSAPDLAVSARVAGVTQNDGLNHYAIAVTVRNVGSAPSGWQFVDVYKNGEKKDAKGIPSLGPGRSYTYTYGYNRSREAGNGTIDLSFQPASRSGCNTSNEGYVLTF
ncbi:MAG TPA: CARDB domain-containing protein [Candidatus Binatia bacterium]|nr:CARDB domain-containing protein [Candidatus Binatia bacterium]